MFLTHTNSVYSEDITLLDYIPYPQYVHQIAHGGGPLVKRGLKMMCDQLVDYILKGKYGASGGTYDFIHKLTQSKVCKVGFILAAGGTRWTGYLTNVIRSDQYPTYKIPAMGATQVYAGYIANQLGSFEYIATDSSSCISGHSAWYTANNMMKLNILDAVVVVTVDDGTSEEYLSIFGEYGLSKLAEEENNPDIVKFRLGQGCNISVFENGYSLWNSGYKALAKITDMHVAAETHNTPLGISCSGAGYRKVINNVNTDGIDFVKTHSTFSKDNQIEAAVLKEKFGDIRTVNYKLRIGHTMGSSTAVETALAIQEESGKFLSLGAGMGNVFSSAVVEIIK
jgi:hypothetical protein